LISSYHFTHNLRKCKGVSSTELVHPYGSEEEGRERRIGAVALHPFVTSRLGGRAAAVGGKRAFAAAARQLTSFPEAVIRPTISRPLQISDRPWRIPDFLRECNLIGQVRWELTFR
jgi:hypothetical protein